MPAWTGAGSRDGFVGVKVVSVFPDNGAKGMPSVSGTYLLMDGGTGVPQAALDGTRLTLWRTAAASALAGALSGPRRMPPHGDGRAGALAPFLIRAHLSQRPIDEVAALEPSRPRRPRRWPPSCARAGLPVAADADLERGGAGRRYRLLRDAVDRRPSSRRMAEARRPSRSRRRLQSRACARPTTRRCGGRRSISTRPRPGPRAATWRSPSQTGAIAREPCARRPRGSVPEQRAGRSARGGDHRVQIGRHSARGFGSGDAGVADRGCARLTSPDRATLWFLHH